MKGYGIRPAVFLVLTIVLLFDFSGFYVFYLLNRYEIRREIRADIASGELKAKITVIEVASEKVGTSVVRVKEDEILYEGSLYDVVRETRDAGKATFYCIHDKKEESLIRMYTRRNSNRGTQLMQTLLLQKALLREQPVAPCFSEEIIIHRHYNDNVLSRTVSPEPPPPELS